MITCHVCSSEVTHPPVKKGLHWNVVCQHCGTHIILAKDPAKTNPGLRSFAGNSGNILSRALAKVKNIFAKSPSAPEVLQAPPRTHRDRKSLMR